MSNFGEFIYKAKLNYNIKLYSLLQTAKKMAGICTLRKNGAQKVPGAAGSLNSRHPLINLSQFIQICGVLVLKKNGKIHSRNLLFLSTNYRRVRFYFYIFRRKMSGAQVGQLADDLPFLYINWVTKRGTKF